MSKVKTSDVYFSTYIKEQKQYAIDQQIENYYPVNVVAEAFQKGFDAGAKNAESDYLEDLKNQLLDKFVSKANEVYILSNELIKYLQSNQYKIDSLLGNFSFNSIKVLITVPITTIEDETFTELAYTKLHEIAKQFTSQHKELLDISIIPSEDLDEELLESDGFRFKEDYVKK